MAGVRSDKALGDDLSLLAHFANASNANAPPLLGERSDKAPGDDLLLHGLSHTTIGAAAFHFRVRDGIGWDHSANFTRELVRVAQQLRGLGMGTWDVIKRRLCARHFVEASSS